MNQEPAMNQESTINRANGEPCEEAHGSELSDSSNMWLPSSDLESCGSNRKYHESTFDLISDTSISSGNSSPKHDLSIEVPIIYNEQEKKKIRLEPVDDNSLSPSLKRQKLEDNVFFKTF